MTLLDDRVLEADPVTLLVETPPLMPLTLRMHARDVLSLWEVMRKGWVAEVKDVEIEVVSGFEPQGIRAVLQDCALVPGLVTRLRVFSRESLTASRWEADSLKRLCPCLDWAEVVFLGIRAGEYRGQCGARLVTTGSGGQYTVTDDARVVVRASEIIDTWEDIRDQTPYDLTIDCEGQFLAASVKSLVAGRMPHTLRLDYLSGPSREVINLFDWMDLTGLKRLEVNTRDPATARWLPALTRYSEIPVIVTNGRRLS